MSEQQKENGNVDQDLNRIEQQLERQGIQIDRLKRQISRHRGRIRRIKRQLGLVSDYDNENFSDKL